MAHGDDSRNHPNRRVDRNSMTVRFPVDERNYRSASVNDPSQAQDSGYNEDAASFIETGEWGALDPEQNQHLIPHRERYLKALEADRKGY